MLRIAILVCAAVVGFAPVASAAVVTYVLGTPGVV